MTCCWHRPCRCPRSAPTSRGLPPSTDHESTRSSTTGACSPCRRTSPVSPPVRYPPASTATACRSACRSSARGGATRVSSRWPPPTSASPRGPATGPTCRSRTPPNRASGAPYDERHAQERRPVKAVRYEAYREPPFLADVPEPDCPDDGVLVRVAATGVCRSDWHAWQGHDPVPLPHTPGHEFAGVIAEVGPRVRHRRGRGGGPPPPPGGAGGLGGLPPRD